MTLALNGHNFIEENVPWFYYSGLHAPALVEAFFSPAGDRLNVISTATHSALSTPRTFAPSAHC